MRSTRLWSAGAMALAFLLVGSASIAMADQVYNNLDATVDATSEVMNLFAGGTDGSTVMKLRATTAPGGDLDPQLGCNLAGAGAQVTFGVTSTDPTKVTVSPSTVQFTACDPNAGSSATLTVHPLAGGTATVRLTFLTTGTPLTTTQPVSYSPTYFLLNFATFTVNVAVPTDTVPPDTALATHPNSLSNSASASFSFTGTDNVTPAANLTFTCSLDAAAFVPCTSPAAYTALGDGVHTFHVRAKDAANNVDPSPDSFSWTVDTGAPTITFAGTATSAWYASDVSASWSCADPNGVVATTVGATTAGEGAALPASATCTDNAGNTASDTQYFMVDKTAPTVSFT